jgi:DnaJ-class molecular chaperone
MAEDYYKTLGVNRDASPAEIQKAYRALARKYHPDLHPDDKTATKKFQEVQKAFDVLNDASKRELYDRYGSSFESMAGGPGGQGPAGGFPGGGGPGGQEFDFSQFFGERSAGDPLGAFGDMFGQFRRAGGGSAGGGRARSAPRRGADVSAEIDVPLVTAVLGGEAQLRVARGSGKVETINVKIPAGIEDGKKIRLRGQGEGTGDTAGDLLITIHVLPHPHFQRRGDNLDVKVPVSLLEAASGAKVDLPTPKGTITLRVPAGTSSGTKLRVKGHGVAAKGRPPGDLFADIQIMLPKPLDKESLELIKQIDARTGQTEKANLRADLHW